MINRGDTLTTRFFRLPGVKKLSVTIPTTTASRAIKRIIALLDKKLVTLFAFNLFSIALSSLFKLSGQGHNIFLIGLRPINKAGDPAVTHDHNAVRHTDELTHL